MSRKEDIKERHLPNVDQWIPGDWWMVCDECGLDFRRSEMRKRWDNAWVCHNDWEIKHPQEGVRGIPEKIRVPVARPVPADNNLIKEWVNSTYDTFESDGSTITRAAGDTPVYLAISNDTGMVSGTDYNITSIVDLTSGEYPSLYTGTASSPIVLLAELSETNGINNINFTADSNTYIWLLNSAATDYSLTITLTKIVTQDDL